MSKFIRPLSRLVALLLVVGGIGLATRTGTQDKGTYLITAYFEKAIGLFENSDVMILGVPVGKVVDVNPEGTQVRVDMEVDKDHPVPADARAQIVPISVIADRYIQLFPVYESGPVMEDGDVLDVSRTQIPAELDDVFKQLKKLLDAIEPGEEGEPGALGNLIVQLNETLSGQEENLKGTLVNAAQLTDILADAETELSDILINLDTFLTKLAQRAGIAAEFNSNLAIVMATLAESREDLEATLANLAGLTTEVADVVRDHRVRLGEDLELASRITSTIVDNRSSVEQALSWLPVVGIGISNAYHGGDIKAVDVRDNSNARLECQILDALPPSPIRDELEQICNENTVAAPTTIAPAEAGETFDCDLGVKKVRRQLRKLRDIKLPTEVTEEVLKPFRKRIRELKNKCDELADALKSPRKLLEQILDGVGGIPDIDETLDELNLNQIAGTAAGAGSPPVPQQDSRGFLDRIGGWMSGFLGWLSW